MHSHSDDSIQGQIHKPQLDRLLRFDRHTEERYEAEHGAERVEQLRNSIVFGVLLYVLHGVAKVALFPGSLIIILYVTTLVVFPFAILCYIYIGSISYKSRENLIFAGIVVTTILPVYMMYDPEFGTELYSNVDVLICIIFANVLIALRFRHAFFYTFATLIFPVMAILMNADIDLGLKKALSFQFATVCIVCLYSNYLFERRRCMDYCVSLEAVLRAEAAETSRKQFQIMSKTDSLTGLPNRRFLDEQLDEWASDGRSAAVMMIDIDHFKLFNDTLGHPAGDECLRTIADAIKDVFSQPGQFCARFGGEEFTLAVRDVDVLQACRLAGVVVSTIEALQIPHPGRNDGLGIVTISVGLALKPASEMTTTDKLLTHADEALYLAKRRGRNRFVLSEEMPVSPLQVSL
ncbi:MAG: diguanylate cyclase [Hoeflea sp.]|uniref:diguanylate cyclase n=1 Tax=Hoeflea sp. TaxID=1940281 RepID=UPI003EF15AD1